MRRGVARPALRIGLPFASRRASDPPRKSFRVMRNMIFCGWRLVVDQGEPYAMQTPAAMKPTHFKSGTVQIPGRAPAMILPPMMKRLRACCLGVVLAANAFSAAATATDTSSAPIEISGIYPHLAFFNSQGECGV